MNTSDSPQNTAILNRLILLVLSFILVCLVLLVIRAYTKPAGGAPQTQAVESPATEEEPIPVIVRRVEPAPPNPPRAPATNAMRGNIQSTPAPTPVPRIGLQFKTPNAGLACRASRRTTHRLAASHPASRTQRFSVWRRCWARRSRKLSSISGQRAGGSIRVE